MRQDIREMMESWARWCWCRRGGMPAVTQLGKVIEGLPRTTCPECRGWKRTRQHSVCPKCDGTGRVRLDPHPPRTRTIPCPAPGCRYTKDGSQIGEIGNRTCHRCYGAGEIVVVEQQINPAFIPSTWREPDDRITQRIDRLVAELRRRDKLLGYYYVVRAEYRDARAGDQRVRAERMHISHENYRLRLFRVLTWIEYGLDCMEIPAENLRFPAPKKTA